MLAILVISVQLVERRYSLYTARCTAGWNVQQAGKRQRSRNQLRIHVFDHHLSRYRRRAKRERRINLQQRSLASSRKKKEKKSVQATSSLKRQYCRLLVFNTGTSHLGRIGAV